MDVHSDSFEVCGQRQRANPSRCFHVAGSRAVSRFKAQITATCSSSKIPTISRTYFQVTVEYWHAFFFWHIGHSNDYQTVDITITNEAERLTQALSEYPLGPETQPLILLSFDESHTLTVAVENTTDEEKPKPTYFTCLRRALRALIKHSVFSFFLSTTCNVFQFTLPPKKDPSSRGQEGRLLPIPSYSDIGFDQLAPKVCENTLKIEDVAKVQFMVKLGRPLLVSCGRFLHHLN